MFNINGYGLVLMLLIKIEELQQELYKYRDNENKNWYLVLVQGSSLLPCFLLYGVI